MIDNTNPSIIALIPARGGSKRVPGKNIRTLEGHPLIAYTIAAATRSQIFTRIIVSTDSPEIASIAQDYGAEVPWLRSSAYATDQSPDIEWVKEALSKCEAQGEVYDCFSILRPTSPLRQAETIQRAWATFRSPPEMDSLRAVEKCKQHPGKMWLLQQDLMEPLLTQVDGNTVPWHSTPYQALPEVYVQNASLEMAWGRVIWETESIAGTKIRPFLTQGWEGLDINDAKDWWYLEHLLEQKLVSLPPLC
ncbi:acylneuraminate cytidylyltransferase family protein [Gloeocapsa sp. PCC 73106]|uniref:acylneuraminate cytidylyltransferase family protein n=1 Tax=Gloeocapsa sp. PCC 73106 TaxID=102232 RepID=UPI0002ABB0CA|nr:acylneuraminate cytidylyltransferase family protein [Gloeocapsa sp. PCC 73106]ELR98067.1 CMP-N-acetylneuraminic acid synthetase [Gloeocapsa sp. PCC 73106]